MVAPVNFFLPWFYMVLNCTQQWKQTVFWIFQKCNQNFNGAISCTTSHPQQSGSSARGRGSALKKISEKTRPEYGTAIRKGDNSGRKCKKPCGNGLFRAEDSFYLTEMSHSIQKCNITSRKCKNPHGNAKIRTEMAFNLVKWLFRED